MAVADDLARLAARRAFWSDYFDEHVWYPDHDYGGADALLVFDLPVARGYALRVAIRYGEGTLSVRGPGGGWVHVANNANDGHPMPHALRWQEADLIGRAVALLDPALPHPGVPYLLMLPFVVSLDPADHAVTFPLAAAALRSLGLFSERRIGGMARGRPFHLTGAAWDRTPQEGWVVHPPGLDGDWLDRLVRGLPTVHSGRQAGDGRFPFADWNRFVAAADRACRRRRPAWFAADPTAVALADRAAAGDLSAAGPLADRLEEGGPAGPTLVAALRSGEPARAAWVLELLRGQKQGELICRLCPSPPPPGPPHRLCLDVCSEPGEFHVRRHVLPTLMEHGIGNGWWQGGCFAADLVPPTDPPLREGFDIHAYTDFDAAVGVLRDALRGRPGNYPAALFTVDRTITDGPQYRPVPLDPP
jgi:hypothetical protein